eukprot:8552681-Ditylum_brightwellii.AAC.1
MDIPTDAIGAACPQNFTHAGTAFSDVAVVVAVCSAMVAISPPRMLSMELRDSGDTFLFL